MDYISYSRELNWIFCQDFERRGYRKYSRTPVGLSKFLNDFSRKNTKMFITVWENDGKYNITNDCLGSLEDFLKGVGRYLSELNIPTHSISWLADGIEDGRTVMYAKPSQFVTGEYDLVIRKEIELTKDSTGKECQQEVDRLLYCGINDLEAINLPVSEYIYENLHIDDKTSRFGTCMTRSKYSRISVSRVLLGLEGLRNTIYHELIHTCRGAKGHDAVWVRYAKVASNAYDVGEIKRTSDHDEKGISDDAIKHNYKIVCKECGYKGYRQKLTSALKEITTGSDAYRCNRCKGKLEVQDKNGFVLEPIESVPKYEIICVDCGTTSYKSKRSKVVEHPYNYSCSRCGGTLRVKQNY
jgi:predicted SprT family Zn-dependent metalloprotease